MEITNYLPFDAPTAVRNQDIDKRFKEYTFIPNNHINITSIDAKIIKKYNLQIGSVMPFTRNIIIGGVACTVRK